MVARVLAQWSRVEVYNIKLCSDHSIEKDRRGSAHLVES